MLINDVLQCFVSTQGKKVIILLELEVLQSGSEVKEKIGNPTSINPDGTVPADQNKPQNSSSSASGATNTPGKRSSSEAPVGQPAAKRSMLDNVNSSNILASNVFPIASLTPYQVLTIVSTYILYQVFFPGSFFLVNTSDHSPKRVRIQVWFDSDKFLAYRSSPLTQTPFES